MRFTHEMLTLSDSEFAILRDLIRERAGLIFENNKRQMLAEKLSSRVLERGFESFIDYYYLLKYGPGADDEWPFVLDALSVQETYFWREMDQVRALVDIIVPRHFAQPNAAPMRIWSVPCATGEEPLTIAMALNEAGWFHRGDIRISASDGSPAAISKARQGVYTERSFRNLPEPLRQKYFSRNEKTWTINSDLHRRVDWSIVNLVHPVEVVRQFPLDVVFCRNVFIYFSADAIRRTVRLFYEGMASPAYLFVGVSESLLKYTVDFELQEVGSAFVYVKR